MKFLLAMFALFFAVSARAQIINANNVLLMQRDSGVTGPIHVFTLAEPYTSYTCSGCGTLVPPLWGANLLMATGPGQTTNLKVQSIHVFQAPPGTVGSSASTGAQMTSGIHIQ